MALIPGRMRAQMKQDHDDRVAMAAELIRKLDVNSINTLLPTLEAMAVHGVADAIEGAVIACKDTHVISEYDLMALRHEIMDTDGRTVEGQEVHARAQSIINAVHTIDRLDGWRK